MLTIDFVKLKSNIKKNFDTIANSSETMMVTRKNNKNIVIMSEEYYNNIMENIYVLGNPANFSWLEESLKQLEEGNVIRSGEWDNE